MPRQYTILVRSVNKIVDAAAARGVAPEELYRAVNLDPGILGDPDNRLPFSQLVALYEHAARLTKDDAFGLHVGEMVDAKLFDVLGYVIVNSSTLGEALDRLVRYHSIWSDGAFFDMEIRGPLVHLAYEHADGQSEDGRHDYEMTMSIAVSFARQVTGVDWTPHEVSFQHAEPPDTTEHRRIFRAPIRFGRPANELVFDSSLLALPLTTADPGLCEILDRQAREMLAKLPRQDGIAGDVRRLLAEALNGGDPRLETISQKLGISTRTLQRKLREEGTSHQDLLDEMRSDLSRRYLREPNLAICEVAYLLGFSEPSAFHRAFRRWTGVTPKEFRRAQAP
ncbi:MAG TPA: AraC family transcriptional regulator [Pyrinomonadaceae bacterium]|nr:AraC family transcriptional regulator [Pyrinomonadaceae bacterium]